eukprot:5099413-Karenia_brevis.AAC.1
MTAASENDRLESVWDTICGKCAHETCDWTTDSAPAPLSEYPRARALAPAGDRSTFLSPPPVPPRGSGNAIQNLFER